MVRCDVVPYYLYPSDSEAKVAWWEQECGFSELWENREKKILSSEFEKYIQ